MKDEIIGAVFHCGEEIPSESLKPGEWVIFASEGLGYPPEVPVFLGAKTNHGFAGFSRNDTALYNFNINPEAWKSYPSCRGGKLKFFRAVEQPKITRRHLLGNLGSFAVAYPTSGTDPEVFVEDSNGEIIPAFEFLPKKTPTTRLFWDGFQAEFTVPNAGCQDTLAGAIRQGIYDLRAVMPAGSRLSAKSVVEIPAKTLRSAKAEHLEFGCRPSLNTYGLTGEVIPDPREMPLRFAGGHIHWGFDHKYSEAQWADAVKFVDLVAGLISVSIAEGFDDPRRRKYYGLAGEFRLPRHGVEYRVLSNFWLSRPQIYHLLFTLGRAAMSIGLGGRRAELQTVPEIAVVNAINNSDAELARTLIDQEKDLFKALIAQRWPNFVEPTFAKILQPASAWGIDPAEGFGNWQTGSHGYCKRWYDFVCATGKEAPIANAVSTRTMPDVPGNTEPIRLAQPETR